MDINIFNRDTKDPLIRLMHDVYNMSPVRPIQQYANVGDLHESDGKRTKKRGRINYLLDPPLEMPDLLKDEILPDFDTISTSSVSFKVGFGWAKDFLSALGVGDFAAKLNANFMKQQAKSMKMRFSHVTRDSVDAYELGYRLEDTKLRVKNPFYHPGFRYYLVTAVARSPSICIKAENRDGKVLSVDADILNSLKVSTGVTTSSSTKEELVVSGKRLAFGVEYFEMRYNTKLRRLSFMPAGVIPVGSKEKIRIKPAFIGGEKGDIFVNLEPT